MDDTFYHASNDAMFKMIFGDERDIGPLVAFLQATLDLPLEDYVESIPLGYAGCLASHANRRNALSDIRNYNRCN